MNANLIRNNKTRLTKDMNIENMNLDKGVIEEINSRLSYIFCNTDIEDMNIKEILYLEEMMIKLIELTNIKNSLFKKMIKEMGKLSSQYNKAK